MRIINVNVLGKVIDTVYVGTYGKVYENCAKRKFIARNIFNTKYLRFTVFQYKSTGQFMTVNYVKLP